MEEKNPEISQAVGSEVKVAPTVMIPTTSSNWWKICKAFLRIGILMVGLVLAGSIVYIFLTKSSPLSGSINSLQANSSNNYPPYGFCYKAT